MSLVNNSKTEPELLFLQRKMFKITSGIRPSGSYISYGTPCIHYINISIKLIVGWFVPTGEVALIRFPKASFYLFHSFLIQRILSSCRIPLICKYG